MLTASTTYLAAAPVDGERAMEDIRTQCSFGPRIPGTEGHAACRDWIKAQIAETGLVVWEQSFPATLPLTGAEVIGWNIWGIPPGFVSEMTDAADKLDDSIMLLSAHWDTRPVADNEPRGSSREPFLGANDGGSGVALALEIVRSLKGTPLEGRVALAFYDAEDSGVQKRPESWCLGSQYAAEHLPAWFSKVKLGINLDMVGARGTRLMKEGYSLEAQPREVERLWRTGRALAPGIFVDDVYGDVIDDHYAFIKKGLPYINVIGLPYEHWHRAGDKPEACDPRVMSQIGLVIVEFIKSELRAPRAN